MTLNAADIAPYVSWGTSPGMVAPITDRVPSPDDYAVETDRRAITRALEYMGLEPGTPLQSLALEKVFIGSCTNGRIEDLRAAAAIAQGRKVHADVHALVVPGSAQVKRQAEAEGLDHDIQRGRVRLARGGLLHVPGHEPRHSDSRASAAPSPPTATSRDGRARADAPTSSARKWPPPPPSPDTW